MRLARFIALAVLSGIAAVAAPGSARNVLDRFRAADLPGPFRLSDDALTVRIPPGPPLSCLAGADFAALPDTEGVLTLSLTTEEVATRAGGVYLAVLGEGGERLSVLPDASLRAGSGTRDARIPFRTGGNRRIRVVLGLEQATGTAHFRSVRITAPEPVQPAPRASADPGAGTQPELRTTAHRAFAKPLRDPPEIGLVLPVSALREGTEFSRRFHCKLTLIPTASATRFRAPDPDAYLGDPAAGTPAPDPADLLRRRYDVLIIARQQWDSLPADCRDTIVGHVRGGMGLLYVRPDDSRVPAALMSDESLLLDEDDFPGLELALLPGFGGYPNDLRVLAQLVGAYDVGAGRVVIFTYPRSAATGRYCLTPDIPRFRDGFRHPDVYYAAVAKGVRLARKTVPRVRIRGISYPRKLSRGDPLTVTLAVDGPEGLPVVADVAVRDTLQPYDDPPLLFEETRIRDGAVSFSAPTDLPEGEFSMHITLRADGFAEDWTCGRFFIRGSPTITGLAPVRPGLLEERLEILPFSVSLDAPLPPGHTLVADMRDAYGTTVGTLSTDRPDRDFSLRIACSASATIFNELTARVLDETGKTLSGWRIPILIRRSRAPTDFLFAVCGNGGRDYTGALALEQLRGLGVDAAVIAAGRDRPFPLEPHEAAGVQETALEHLRHDIRPIFRVGRILPVSPAEGEAADLRHGSVRYAELVAAAVEQRYRACREFAPLALTIGPGNIPPAPADIFPDPARTDSYIRALEEAYGDPETLAGYRGTPIRPFAEIPPLAATDAGGPQGLPDALFSERMAADIFREMLQPELKDAGPACGPMTDGTPRPGAYRLAPTAARPRALQTVPLRDHTAIELVRSAGFGADAIAGVLVETARCAGPRGRAVVRWAPWHALFHGMNSVWYSRDSTLTSGLEDAGMSPLPTPRPLLIETADSVRALKAGPGSLWLTATPEPARAAILYSPSSAVAGVVDPRCDGHAAALDGAVQLLTDLGVPFDIVSEDRLPAPEAFFERYAVLVLPTVPVFTERLRFILAASPGRPAAIIADVLPALYDEHGKALDGGVGGGLFGFRRTAGSGPAIGTAGVPGLLPPCRTDPGIVPDGSSPGASADGIPVMLRRSAGTSEFLLINAGLDMCRPNHDGSAAGLREEIAALLDQVGVSPDVRVTSDGEPLMPLEVFSRRHGDTRLIAILPDPDAPPGPREAAVRTGRSAHVHDVLRGEYLGETDAVSIRLEPGEPVLLSVSPALPDEIRLTPARGAPPGSYAVRVLAKGRPLGTRLVRVEYPGIGPGSPARVSVLVTDEDGEGVFRLPAGTPAGVERPADLCDVASGLKQRVAVSIPVADEK